MPESGVKFWAYDSVKLFVCADPRKPRVVERLLAGGIAGAASCIAIYPLEVAKTRLAVASPGTYEGVAHCMRSTVRAEGIGALYKGLGASLIGIMPFSAVDLALYNTFKAELRYHRRSEPGTLTMLGCGALSSSLAQLATYPLALAKTRLQASGMPGFIAHYDGLVGCLVDTVQKDGFKVTHGAGRRTSVLLASHPTSSRALFPLFSDFSDLPSLPLASSRPRPLPLLRPDLPRPLAVAFTRQGLYRGIVPNLLKAVPSISISYVVFENTKAALMLRGWSRPPPEHNRTS